MSDVHSRCRIYYGYYDYDLIEAIDPSQIRVVFGDNTIRRGNGGQAIIRDCAASFGLATKRLPSQYDNSFFSDCATDQLLVEQDILQLERLLLENKDLIVYFPEHGLGTGLSDMPNKCPKLFKHMNQLLLEKFGVDYGRFN